MSRNTLCEAEPDEPGERSAFGAIRTGIELCERQPRQSSGSVGQPDLAPNAMPDTVLIVPAAGMRRIVAHRAEVEMPEFSFSPPNSPTLGIPVVLASRESYGRLRIASGQRRRLKQQEESGSGLVRKPAADRTGRQPDAYIHAVGTDGPQQEGDPQRRVHRKVAPYRATTADRTRRTSRRGRSPRPCRGFSHRYCRSADTQMRTLRNPSTSFHGPSARSQTILNGA